MVSALIAGSRALGAYFSWGFSKGAFAPALRIVIITLRIRINNLGFMIKDFRWLSTKA
jgi:hypothetical protein